MKDEGVAVRSSTMSLLPTILFSLLAVAAALTALRPLAVAEPAVLIHPSAFIPSLDATCLWSPNVFV